MLEKGKLLGIAIKKDTNLPMIELTEAQVTLESGVDSDFRGKPGRRQITVVSREAWEEACSELGVNISWINRRANILIEGLPTKGKIGYELQIGETLLKITGETKPCTRMDQNHQGLQNALKPEWRGGVTCQVLKPGKIEVGSDVLLKRNILRQQMRLMYHFGRKLYKRIRAVMAKKKQQVLNGLK